MRITAPPGRFEATNVTARMLILNAYGLPDFLIANVPGWAGDERFDVSGRASSPVPRDQLSAMVRSLLAERFQLRAHRETREMPTYALVTAAPDRRLGPALRGSALDCDADNAPTCRTRMAPSSVTATGMTMARLAQTLRAIVGRVVTDETGLTGTYDFELRFAPDQQPPPGAPPVDPDAPSIFTALREQLGLRLEGKRGPVEMLVIDRLERPTVD
jgi:uncharacterized protein (TIGR03435 family)